tara:strand:- start:224 stop:424 length:201 start_codon:yes stop_codon:yes gene_type:complete
MFKLEIFMNLKKGLLRIYLVTGTVWSLFFTSLYFYGSTKDDRLLIMIILPIPIYFTLKWILEGFSK